MTAPEHSANPPEVKTGDRRDAPAPVVSGPALQVIQKRRDFLAAARARKWAASSLVLQGRKRQEFETSEKVPEDAIRVGFTASKKVGNAVARNCAKRRLREAARALLPIMGRPGWDYVLIARAGATAALPYEKLLEDLKSAIERVHVDKKNSGRRNRKT